MLARAAVLVATLTLAGCSGADTAGDEGADSAQSQDDATPAIAAVLDDFHAAAADGDADRYLAHFTGDGVFFGTDPAERWTKQQFEPYVRERFGPDGGWTYVPRDRTIFVSDDGSTAWFDEMLDGATGMTARGTGVLVRQDAGWRVAQYNFSVPFPNALWDTIGAMIRAQPVEDSLATP